MIKIKWYWIILFIYIGTTAGIVCGKHIGYKKGQIDCIQGNIQYEQVNKIHWQSINHTP